MKVRFIISVFLGWVGLYAIAATPLSAYYNIVDLETLGGKRSVARSINDSGQIVGSAQVQDSQDAAFIYQNGTMTNLGTLGGSSGSAWCINDAGDVVGSSSVASGETHAVLWHDGTITDLGMLTGYDTSRAYSINNQGQIVGYSESWGERCATLFDPTGKGNNIDLGTPGEDSSWAFSINDAGQVVGWTGDRNERHATLFNPTGSGNNIDLSGGNYSGAYDISNEGQIVGWSDDPKNGRPATLFDPTGNGNNIDLGCVSYGACVALAINDRGEIVGYDSPHAQLARPGFRLAVAGSNRHQQQRLDRRLRHQPAGPDPRLFTYSRTRNIGLIRPRWINSIAQTQEIGRVLYVAGGG